MVLTHGAGGDCNAPLLVALAERFSSTGWTVLRCDLPFRQIRRHGPPRGNGEADRQGLRRAVEVVREIARGRVILGGQSYGGRQATMLASEESALVDGLLVLSYPLHPPGKPEQLRTAHLTKLKTPALFVSGAADPFGSPSELEGALELIPGAASLVTIDGVGHDLGFSRRMTQSKQREVLSRIVAAFYEFFAR
jgi:predicted alpha/beta-hydrolase family hydrolase